MNKIEEAKTVRERTITLELSDADVKRIYERSGYVGLTVAELLQNFVGDLVDGTYTNGSDERMRANQWFNRCWFAMDTIYDDTFLKYLLEMGMVEDVVGAWNEVTRYEKMEALDEDDCVYYEDGKTFVNENFDEYVEDRISKGRERPNLAKEMKVVIRWWNEYQQMNGK